MKTQEKSYGFTSDIEQSQLLFSEHEILPRGPLLKKADRN
jgi:hypothetical protein